MSFKAKAQLQDARGFPLIKRQIEIPMQDFEPQLIDGRLILQVPIFEGPIFTADFRETMVQNWGARAEDILERHADQIFREQVLLTMTDRL